MADKKISEITAELKACDISALAGFIDTYQVDERPGVVKLVGFVDVDDLAVVRAHPAGGHAPDTGEEGEIIGAVLFG